MEPVKLVGTNLAALESDFASFGKTDRIYFDTEIAGFGLRFRSGGKRTWVLQYKHHGLDKRLTLGPYPGLNAKTARAMAQDKLADVWKGKDPQQAKRDAKAAAQAQIPLRTVIDNFLATKQSKLRPLSFYESQRYLLKDWKPLHSWPIAEIQIPQVATILDRLEKAGPVAAARSRSNLSAVFRWAMGHGYVKHNPVIGTINPDTGVPRDRVLSDRELAAGSRRYVLGKNLDFDNRAWTIPGSRTKNKTTHVLPLPHAFWEIIETIERRPGRDHLFGYSSRGYQSWGEPKQALDQRCQIPAWTHHDLRRTMATRLGDIGVQPHIIETILNHTSGHRRGVAGTYNRSAYTREVKTALAMWADYLHANIVGAERNIIPIGAAPIPG